jgi:CAAX prenyl protease-like protein
VAAGGVVFAAWIAMDSWSGPQAPADFAGELAAVPTLVRLGWLAFRVAAAILTVPIAEELAFRGCLARRLAASDFESVRFQELQFLPILVSSVLFGALHGGQWIAGTLAGAVYALVLRRSGRIGDAVVAHATTNALLAAWVMTRGAWHLW